METYTKMAGLSAKNIPYGIHGIHMELASIPPGIRLECGGTVKTSDKLAAAHADFASRGMLVGTCLSSTWDQIQAQALSMCFNYI